MSTTQTPDKSRHSLALWAALTALFTNLAAVNLLALFGTDSPRPYAQAIVSIITAFFVAATIYAKQRWDEAKTASRKRT